MSSKIRLENIRYEFSGRAAVDNISISFQAPHIYGIIGPNGCGKTTLLDLIIDYKKPLSGSVTFNQKPLTDYGQKQIAKQMALVPQNFYINFPFTVEEVVMMGRYPHIPRFSRPSADDRQIADSVMQQTDVFRLKQRYVTQLSGGERQRVIFARALAQQTPVLLLDEATSNMDINHSIAVLKIAAEEVKRRKTMVIAVMQDLNLAAMFCDQLVFMKTGRVLAQGPIDETLTRDTVRAVFDVDSKVYFDTYCQSNQIVFKR